MSAWGPNLWRTHEPELYWWLQPDASAPNAWRNSGFDLQDFFASIPDLFPGITTVFIDGTAISDDVAMTLCCYAEAGDYLPEEQGRSRTLRQFRCRYSSELLGALIELCNRNAEIEICDAVHFCTGDTWILSMYDSGSDIVLPGTLPESQTTRIASQLRGKIVRRPADATRE